MLIESNVVSMINSPSDEFLFIEYVYALDDCPKPGKTLMDQNQFDTPWPAAGKILQESFHIAKSTQQLRHDGKGHRAQ